MSPIGLLWLFVIFTSLQPMLRQRLLEGQRVGHFHGFEDRPKSGAIGLVDR